MPSKLPPLGFIGLGAMGGPMSRNLREAGYDVYGYDISEERLAAAASAQLTTAPDVKRIITHSEVILTSLPSSDAFINVAEADLLPGMRAGQILIDLGTTTPPETRRLAGLFAAKGIDLLDVPVSGGPGGAESARLYMFMGGSEETVNRCRPILETIGGPDQITYCGPSGSGQIVKGVNQLMMGIVNAAYLEAIAFGVNGGVDAETIRRAIGHTGRWRKDFSQTAKQITQGQGQQIGVKFRELPYFLREAEENSFSLPLTKTLYDFCDAGERIVIDDNRAAPSFWHQLVKNRE